MRIVLLAFIYSIAVVTAIAQAVAPSPDAMGLAKLANIPVNYYTGSAGVSIPLTQVGGNEISVPISMYYNASGHKVQEMAGSIGLGWNLQAGGLITRIVRGLPDDVTGGYCKANPTDTEPDLYFYNFLGQSGKFVQDKIGRAILTPYRDIIIVPGTCASASNGVWQIIDENGFTYKFGVTTNARETTTITNPSGTKVYTSTWFLSEIISPNSTETIQFSYTSSQFSSTSYFFQKQKDACHNNTLTNLTATIVTNTRHISTITAPLGSINFYYASDRKDIPGSLYLTSLVVTNNVNYQQVQKFRFEYGYFQASNCSSSDCFRLKLDKIYDLAPDPMFAFSYNTSINLPSRYSKNFDDWGYYNNNTVDSWFPQDYPTTGSSGAFRGTDPDRVQANILTELNERGGGRKQFIYEANTAGNTGANRIIGGVRIKSVSTQDGNGNSYVKSYNYIAASNPNLSSGHLYKLPRYIIPDGGNYLLFTHSINDIFDLNGVFVGYSRVEEVTEGNGRIEYYFTNFDSNPDYFNPSTNYVTGLSWERGNPYLVKTYGEQGNLLSEQITDYNFNLPIKRNLNFIEKFQWSWSCSCGFLCQNNGTGSGTYKHTVVSKPFTVSRVTQKIYDPSDISKYTSQITEYSYDPNTLLLTQSVQYDAARPSIKYIVKNKYVSHDNYLGSYDNCFNDLGACESACLSEPDPTVRDYCILDCQSQYNGCMNSPPSNLDPSSLAIYYLRSRHQVAVPVETNTLQQEGTAVKLLASSLSTFQSSGTNPIRIYAKESWAFNQAVDENAYTYSNVLSDGSFQKDTRMRKLQSFDLYDQTSGALLKKTSADETVTSYQWEANKKYLASVTTNPDTDPRTVSYTNKPLVGQSSVTDVNGISTKYEYDVYNRLKMVKDANEKILQNYRYHYKNETPAFRIVASSSELLVNETINLTAVDIAASVGGTPTFLWDFGDGTVVDNNSTSVNHAYANAGTYTVKLVGMNPEYGPVTRTLQVGVYAPMSLDICVDGPTNIDVCGIESSYYGSCTVNNASPYSPTDLTISVTNGCQSSYTYSWEYQNTSSGNWISLGSAYMATISPSTFSVGSYEVRCTVTDGCSNQTSTSTYISVYRSDPNCPALGQN